MTVDLDNHNPRFKNVSEISIMLRFAQCLAENVRIDEIYHMQCKNEGSVYALPILHPQGHFKVIFR